MPNWFRDRRLLAALPWICAAVATAIAARNLIGGYGDLGIYLDVARELREGGEDIYRARATSGPWAYPPVAALPLAGLQAFLPDAAIRWMWCVGLGLATALLVIDLRAILARLGGLRWWQWAVFAVLFQRTIAQNLTHGQLSLWVAVAVVRGSRLLVDGKDVAAGIWLGIATALKLTPALFLVALPLMRCRRAAVAMAATIASAILLLPWPFLGGAEHLRHLHDFHRAVLAPLVGDGTQRVTEFAAGPSIAGTLEHVLQARPVDAAGRTLHLVDLDPGTLRAVKAVWSALLLALVLAWGWRARTLPAAERLAAQSGAVAMAIVLFSPLTRIYHLAGALLPLLLFCRGPRPRTWLWLPTALVLLFAMTLRQRKLLGDTLWRHLEVAPLHLALVAVCAWLWLTTPRPPAPPR